MLLLLMLLLFLLIPLMLNFIVIVDVRRFCFVDLDDVVEIDCVML